MKHNVTCNFFSNHQKNYEMNSHMEQFEIKFILMMRSQEILFLMTVVKKDVVKQIYDSKITKMITRLPRITQSRTTVLKQQS